MQIGRGSIFGVVYAPAVRALFRLFVIVLIVAFLGCVGVAVSFWMESDAVIARAAEEGAFAQPPNGDPHLTMAEHTIALDQFSQTWGTRATPCRTAALLWTDLTTPNATIPGMPVSQRLATALLARQGGGTSIRRQLQRIVVACQLEQRFDDTPLLRAWLATAYFGENARGIDGAAQAIFGKPAAALSADEAARLAALLRAPNLRNLPDAWTQRAERIKERVTAQTR